MKTYIIMHRLGKHQWKCKIARNITTQKQLMNHYADMDSFGADMDSFGDSKVITYLREIA